MPRWLLAAIAVLTTSLAIAMSYLYAQERDQRPASSVYGASYIESELPGAVDRRHHRDGDLSGVACVHREGAVYRCVGTFTPSLSAIHTQYDGDLSAHGAVLVDEDARRLQHRDATDVAYDVTLNRRTGKFVTTNVP